MGCCNEKRAQWGRPLAFSSSSAASTGGRSAMRESRIAQSVSFEYVVSTALNVLGPITRTQYHFPHTGARLQVDYRDAPYLTGVPNLRRTKNAPPNSSPANQ